MSKRLSRPIILLGAARSGTSPLGDMLARHPDVAYWSEPRPVWMYGHSRHADDELVPEQITPKIADYIDREFASFMTENGGTRFAEKTPSNTLRVPYVHALYPDCKMVHIIRDGRAVVPSTMRREQEKPRPGSYSARARQIPMREWPSYVPVALRTAWRIVLREKGYPFWGPKPKEWRAWVALPPHVRAARQWKACIAAALRDGRRLPPNTYLEIRYEDLIADPAETMRRLLAFCELPESNDTVDYAAHYIERGRSQSFREALTPKEQAEIVPELEPLLTELGYLDDRASA